MNTKKSPISIRSANKYSAPQMENIFEIFSTMIENDGLNYFTKDTFNDYSKRFDLNTSLGKSSITGYLAWSQIFNLITKKREGKELRYIFNKDLIKEINSKTDKQIELIKSSVSNGYTIIIWLLQFCQEEGKSQTEILDYLTAKIKNDPYEAEELESKNKLTNFNYSPQSLKQNLELLLKGNVLEKGKRVTGKNTVQIYKTSFLGLKIFQNKEYSTHQNQKLNTKEFLEYLIEYIPIASEIEKSGKFVTLKTLRDIFYNNKELSRENFDSLIKETIISHPEKFLLGYGEVGYAELSEAILITESDGNQNYLTIIGLK